MPRRFPLLAILLLACAALPVVAQGPPPGPRPQWGRPHPPRVGACFYKESEFRGDYFCLKLGERVDALPYGFNDKISSIRVFNGAVVRVFADAGFSGMSLHLDRDIDSLTRFRLPRDPGRTWNDRISSIAVVRDRDDWDRAHPY